LRVVVGRNASTSAALAARYGVIATDDLGAVLADGEIDAVIDCGTSGTRADLAVAALRAGKHVVLEKPMALTPSDADRIIAAERESGRRVAVISQHRFDRSAQRVFAAIRSGGLGTVTSAIASCAWWRGQSYYDSAVWRGTWELDGGGAAMIPHPGQDRRERPHLRAQQRRLPSRRRARPPAWPGRTWVPGEDHPSSAVPVTACPLAHRPFTAIAVSGRWSRQLPDVPDAEAPGVEPGT
jgi:Oxidoreductase family, NAD-binding Rossmann fold